MTTVFASCYVTHMTKNWNRIAAGSYDRIADGYKVTILRNDTTRRWDWISLVKCSDGKWDMIQEGSSSTLTEAKSASSYWIRKFHADCVA